MIAPRKILAIKLRALGDTVLMTAPLLELRRAYPDAEIHVVVTQAWAPLLEKHPAVDRIWLYERHPEATSRAKAIARLALKLRKERYDLTLNFHASPSSSTLAFALGSKTRSIHFHGHKDKNRYSTVTVPGKGTLKPVIERDMDTVRALGLTIPEGKLPQIFVDTFEIEKAVQRLDILGSYGPILCLGIGSSRPTKCWPIERFASVAIQWCDQYRGSVIVFNSRAEVGIAQQFYAALDERLVTWYADPSARRAVRARIINETEIPLRQMSAIMRKSHLYLGNDSGPKHIAVASGLPTITLFGPEDPYEWHPYPRNRHPIHFIDGLSCRNDQDPGMRPWCGLHVCVAQEHRCMRGLSEDEVFATVKRMAEEMKLDERGP